LPVRTSRGDEMFQRDFDYLDNFGGGFSAFIPSTFGCLLTVKLALGLGVTIIVIARTMFIF
jgi:hypothetical protein